MEDLKSLNIRFVNESSDTSTDSSIVLSQISDTVMKDTLFVCVDSGNAYIDDDTTRNNIDNINIVLDDTVLVTPADAAIEGAEKIATTFDEWINHDASLDNTIWKIPKSIINQMTGVKDLLDEDAYLINSATKGSTMKGYTQILISVDKSRLRVWTRLLYDFTKVIEDWGEWLLIYNYSNPIGHAPTVEKDHEMFKLAGQYYNDVASGKITEGEGEAETLVPIVHENDNVLMSHGGLPIWRNISYLIDLLEANGIQGSGGTTVEPVELVTDSIVATSSADSSSSFNVLFKTKGSKAIVLSSSIIDGNNKVAATTTTITKLTQYKTTAITNDSFKPDKNQTVYINDSNKYRGFWRIPTQIITEENYTADTTNDSNMTIVMCDIIYEEKDNIGYFTFSFEDDIPANSYILGVLEYDTLNGVGGGSGGGSSSGGSTNVDITLPETVSQVVVATSLVDTTSSFDIVFKSKGSKSIMLSAELTGNISNPKSTTQAITKFAPYKTTAINNVNILPDKESSSIYVNNAGHARGYWRINTQVLTTTDEFSATITNDSDVRIVMCNILYEEADGNGYFIFSFEDDIPVGSYILGVLDYDILNATAEVNVTNTTTGGGGLSEEALADYAKKTDLNGFVTNTDIVTSTFSRNEIKLLKPDNTELLAGEANTQIGIYYNEYSKTKVLTLHMSLTTATIAKFTMYSTENLYTKYGADLFNKIAPSSAFSTTRNYYRIGLQVMDTANIGTALTNDNALNVIMCNIMYEHLSDDNCRFLFVFEDDVAAGKSVIGSLEYI